MDSCTETKQAPVPTLLDLIDAELVRLEGYEQQLYDRLHRCTCTEVPQKQAIPCVGCIGQSDMSTLLFRMQERIASIASRMASQVERLEL